MREAVGRNEPQPLAQEFLILRVRWLLTNSFCLQWIDRIGFPQFVQERFIQICDRDIRPIIVHIETIGCSLARAQKDDDLR